MFNIIGHRGWWYVLSTLLLLPGILMLATGGLSPSIDFTGGSLLQVRLTKSTTQMSIRQTVQEAGYPDAVVQTSAEGDALIRIPAIQIDEKAALMEVLRERYQQVEELGFSSIGPVVGAELSRAAIIAIVVASGLILIYMTWAFRHMEHPVRYGTAALIALVHDALFVVGLFAILGRTLDIQIDALFVTAVLTVIGFSVNDTIVVFDRIRENRRQELALPEASRRSLTDTVNFSVNQSLTRSLNTSFTALLVLLALLVLGGPTIRTFVLALTAGFAIGTYSSIFNAACVLVSWEERDLQRVWRRLSGRLPHRTTAL